VGGGVGDGELIGYGKKEKNIFEKQKKPKKKSKTKQKEETPRLCSWTKTGGQDGEELYTIKAANTGKNRNRRRTAVRYGCLKN